MAPQTTPTWVTVFPRKGGGAAPPVIIGEPIDNRAGMIAEMRNMFTEMSRQNQDAIFHGFQRGAQHVAEQMNLE